MYNKLFTKILDSSIWLAPDHTRLVWITFLAAMDEDGFVQYATVANVAARARVSVEAAQAAIDELESPEPSTATEEDDGRRVERVPGGWFVLNAPKYREMVHRVAIREQNRLRAEKFRNKHKAESNALITQDNAIVTQNNARPSVSADPKEGGQGETILPFSSEEFSRSWDDWMEHLRQKKKTPTKVATRNQLKKCADMGEDRAIAMLQHSITNNWIGLFEPGAASGKPKKTYSL